MSSWLITGAQGFLGRHVVARILEWEPGAQILGIGRSPELPGLFSHCVTGPRGRVPAPLPADLPVLPSRYAYRACDLVDTRRLHSIAEQFRPQNVIHLASGLRGDPLSQLVKSNIEATASLLQVLSGVNSIRTLVLGSTGGVYGTVPDNELPISESRCPQPADEYAVTKLAGEFLARNAAVRSGVRLVISRIFNLIGAGQDERHIAGQIALQLARIRHGAEPKLTLHGPLDASRDFIDVRDVARALVHLAEVRSEKTSQTSEIVNIATGIETPVSQLARCFFRQTDLDVTVASPAASTLDVQRHFADVTCLGQTGFRHNYSLESSVDSIWNYYQRLWAI